MFWLLILFKCSYIEDVCKEDILIGQRYEEKIDLTVLKGFVDSFSLQGTTVYMDIFRYDEDGRLESCIRNIKGLVGESETLHLKFLIGSNYKKSLFGLDAKGLQESVWFTRFRFSSSSVPDSLSDDDSKCNTLLDVHTPSRFCFGGFLGFDGCSTTYLAFRRDRCMLQSSIWITKYGYTLFKKLSEMSKEKVIERIRALKENNMERNGERYAKIVRFESFILMTEIFDPDFFPDIKNKSQDSEFACCKEKVQQEICLLVKGFINYPKKDDTGPHDTLPEDLNLNNQIYNLNEITLKDYNTVLNLIAYYYSLMEFNNDNIEDDPSWSVIPIYGKLRNETGRINLEKIVYIDSSKYSNPYTQYTFEFTNASPDVYDKFIQTSHKDNSFIYTDIRFIYWFETQVTVKKYSKTRRD